MILLRLFAGVIASGLLLAASIVFAGLHDWPAVAITGLISVWLLILWVGTRLGTQLDQLHAHQSDPDLPPEGPRYIGDRYADR